MYRENHIRIRVNHTMSEKLEYRKGVRQGCPASPLLFNIFIADILKEVEGISIPFCELKLPGLCYADDTVVLADSIEKLQKAADAISSWLSGSGMPANAGKSAVMAFGPAVNESPSIKLDGAEVASSQEYTYLGVRLNRQLSSEHAARIRAQSGWKTLHAAAATLRNNDVPLRGKAMIVKGLILARMAFGGAIFGLNRGRSAVARKVISAAIATVLGKRRFDRQSGYREMEMIPIEAEVASARILALKRWSSSRLARHVLPSAKPIWLGGQPGKGFRRTWAWCGYAWAKTNGIDLNAPKEIVAARVRERVLRKPYISGDAGAPDALDGPQALWAAEERGLIQPGIAKHLMRVRAGAWALTNDLVRWRRVDRSWKNKCLSCGDNLVETIQHIFTECKKYRWHEWPKWAELQSRSELVYQREWKAVMTQRLLAGSKDDSIRTNMANAQLGAHMVRYILATRNTTG